MKAFKRVPLVRQTSETDCGAACLTMMLHYYGNNIPLHQLGKCFLSSRNGTSIKDIISVGEKMGLVCKAFRADVYKFFDDYRQVAPIMVLQNNNHFIVLESISRDHVTVADPEKGRRKISKEGFMRDFSGIFITVMPSDDFCKKKHYSESVTGVVLENFKEYRSFALGILMTVAVQLCSLIIPFIVRYSVDNITNISLPKLLAFGVSTLCLYGLLSYIRNNIFLKVSFGFWERLSKKVVGKLFEAKLSFFDTRASGDLLSRVNNIATIKDMIVKILNSAIIDGLSVIIFGTVMFVLSPGLFFIVLIIALVQMIFFGFCMKKMQRLINDNIADQEMTGTFLLDIIKNMIMVKGSDYREDIYNRWTCLFLKQKYDGLGKERFNNLFQSVLMSIKLMPTILLLAFGSVYVSSGALTLGGLVAYISLSSYFIEPLMSVIYDINDAVYVKTVIGRLMEIYYTDPETTGDIDAGERVDLISVNNASFEYSSSEKNILSDISFDIHRGEKIAFVGKTGSGKSTIIKLLLGLYDLKQGEIRINGYKISDLLIGEYRKKIGMVLQDTYFFNSTIRNNIDILGRFGMEDVKRAAFLAGLSDEIESMPMGYNTLIGENGKNLSGGQRQRLAIARALIGRPEIVIFDEGTSQLDALTEKNIYRKLKESEITQIVISHRLSTIKDSDRIYYLDKGRIVERGSHDELVTGGGFYAGVWAEQS